MFMYMYVECFHTLKSGDLRKYKVHVLVLMLSVLMCVCVCVSVCVCLCMHVCVTCFDFPCLSFLVQFNLRLDNMY